MTRALLLPVLLIATPAVAGEVLVWSQGNWPASAEVAGTGGWRGGYDGDPWFGSQQGGFLLPGTDDNGGDWGEGSPHDNWLIRGPDLGDVIVEAVFGNEDNDAVGVVLSHDGDATGYVVYQTEDSGPRPRGAEGGPALVLLRVEDGDATALAAVQATRIGGNAPYHRLRVTREGGRLRATLDGTPRIDVVDPRPLGRGAVGVWSFDSGAAADGTAFFDAISVLAFDADDDGLADDDDNCPTDANADQDDADDDGLGDACDPTPDAPSEPGDPGPLDDTDEPGSDAGPGGGGSPGGGGPGADPDAPPSDDAFAGEVIRLAACSGCAGGGRGAGTAAGLLALLALRRGRRRAGRVSA